MTKKIKKVNKLDLDQQFVDALELLSEMEKDLKKQRSECIESIMTLCKNAKSGKFISEPETDREKHLRHEYSKESLEIAKQYLKKYKK